MKQPDTSSEDYTLIFHESVRGLAVGAPVDFRGVPLGEVTRIGLEYDPARVDFAAPVDVRIYPGRLRERFRHEIPYDPGETAQSRLQRLVDRGLRAQLRAGNLLTGQLYVAMDLFPSAARIKFDSALHPHQIPTLPTDDLGASLADVARKVDRLPLDQVIGDVRRLLAKAGSTFADADAAVKQFGPTSPRTADLDEAFQQVTRAARSLRALADSLERHPESLIRGRK